MFRWPNPNEGESKIIEQFRVFREHLTAESAAQFCHIRNCGFLMELYQSNHLDYQGAFQSYLICLRAVLPFVSRSQFLGLFPKACAGCGIVQIPCILYMHPILENEVNDLFRELLCDPRGSILHRNDIRQLSIMIREAYQRTHDPFPYVGNCVDFKHDSEGYHKVQAIGNLFISDKFCQLMKRNPDIGAQIAHEVIKNYRHDDHRSNQLDDLLKKHEELTSEM